MASNSVIEDSESAGDVRDSEDQLMDTSNGMNAAALYETAEQTNEDDRTTLCFSTSGKCICELPIEEITRELRKGYTPAGYIREDSLQVPNDTKGLQDYLNKLQKRHTKDEICRKFKLAEGLYKLKMKLEEMEKSA